MSILLRLLKEARPRCLQSRLILLCKNHRSQSIGIIRLSLARSNSLRKHGLNQTLLFQIQTRCPMPLYIEAMYSWLVWMLKRMKFWDSLKRGSRRTVTKMLLALSWKAFKRLDRVSCRIRFPMNLAHQLVLVIRILNWPIKETISLHQTMTWLLLYLSKEYSFALKWEWWNRTQMISSSSNVKISLSGEQSRKWSLS